MKKIIAAIAATGLLFSIGAAAPAGAETLYRNHGHKVTITAKAATPAGALITKAKVTVKKGHKTVARNKNFYKAKKGTYKVTSTVSYFFSGSDAWVPGATTQGPSTQVQGASTTKNVPVAESDVYAKCTVTNRSVANRTVQAVDFYDATGMSDWATVRGQAAITYTGNCTGTVYDEDYNTHSLTWVDDWTELESVWEVLDMTRAEYDSFNAQAWLENELAKNSNVLYPRFVGDVTYPGSGMDKIPSYTITVPGAWTTIPGQWTTAPGHTVTTPATAVTTIKSVRTVRVK